MCDRNHSTSRPKLAPAFSALLALCLALSSALLPTRALAGAVEGVQFDERISAGPHNLLLHGLGLLRYKIVFRAYVAGLYLENAQDASRVLQDVPKRLELSYFWGLEGKQFGDAAETLLERNVDRETLETLQPRIERMHAAYQDVEPGDRYALTYVPGKGTELALNGRPLVTIEGADFAAAYYAIWLGDNALDSDFKDLLLSGR